MEKRETLYSVGGNVNWTATVETGMEVPQKTKNRTTNDPAIPFLGIYLKKIKTLI